MPRSLFGIIGSPAPAHRIPAWRRTLTECDAETVAEQLDRQNFRVLALAVEDVLQA